MRLTILAAFVLVVTPAFSIELFRYRGAARDDGQRDSKREAAEIAADSVTTFYHVQVGALETQEFRTNPVPFWLICFSDTVKGPIKNVFFVVLLRDGTVVVPRVEKRM